MVRRNFILRWFGRHRRITALLVIAGAVFVGWGSLWVRGLTIEDWVGSQIQLVANEYLGPRLAFKKIRYVAPKTVVIEELTLTAEDPVTRGLVHIIAAKKAVVELAEVPRPGQTIGIERVYLERPEVRLIGGGEAEKFVGFGALIHVPGKRPGESAPPPLAGPVPKPSQVFQIRQIELRDGVLVYDPRKPGTKAMSLDAITGVLDITPREAGGYAVALTAVREGAFTASLGGTLNVDAGTLELSPLLLKAAVSRDSSHILPPALAGFVDKHGIAGSLELRGTGLMAFKDKNQRDMTFTATVKGGSINVGRYRVAIDDFGGRFAVTGAGTTIMRSDATVLGGGVELTGFLPSDHARPLEFDARLRNVRLERVIDTFSSGGNENGLRGALSGTLSLRFPRGKWKSEMAGGGELTLTNATLTKVPGIGPVMAGITQVASVLTPEKDEALERAYAKFTFAGDKANVGTLRAITPEIAIRGEGTVTFDGGLDLRFNGGPLERLQALMGPVGDVWGFVSDAMANYHVTGTLKDVKVEMKAGGRR